jgi:succinate dehydrogenase / fumarate reductase membrane anchor subunit
MSMRSPLARVRGLGSAREGVGHWWVQRMTALALVPLTLWFVAAMIGLTGADYATARDWIGSPVAASLLLLLIVATFYHGALGLQVIIEDYIHHEGAKVASSIAVNALSLLCGLAGVLAVLKVLFGG